ncbi:hypothetical protein WA026_013729 [Henosepilachna vigintioctopunctata]|uniref:Uncharacterized protein n=1 Tax=Henosepilachna vigintioctopunctata TaxID=420089 RepID=A0AAW1UQQ0_9CUCU
MFAIPTVQQYNNAYPQLEYDQPPCPQNGYGWHGNGYGWQLNPEDWKTAPIYPSLNDAEAEDVPTPEPVEEPPIMEQKISKQNAYVSKSDMFSFLSAFIN